MPLSKITMARPAAMAESQNRMGSSGEYQSGYSLVGIIKYRLPSED